MKTMMIGFMAVLIVAGAGSAFAKDYDLNEQESIDLTGVDEVVFDLKGVTCALCIRTLNLMADFSGDGSGGEMNLELTGSITSNRAGAVPSLIVEDQGRTVKISLYPDRASFFGLSQTGTALFEAVLPASYKGDLTVSGSSDDISARRFALGKLDIRSSSGNMEVDEIGSEEVALRISSGNIRGGELFADRGLEIESSSGRIELGNLGGGTVAIKASSGDIRLDRAESTGSMEVKSSSGRLVAGTVVADELRLDSSSGSIRVERLEAARGEIKASSGNVDLTEVEAGNLDLRLSSGDLWIGNLVSQGTTFRTTGDITIDSGRGPVEGKASAGNVEISLDALEGPLNLDLSSGNATVVLPQGSAFDARLETSSGKVRSDFPVLGDLTTNDDEVRGTVNGGGTDVEVRTSSGDVTLIAG